MFNFVLSSIPYVLSLFWPALVAVLLVGYIMSKNIESRTKKWRFIAGIAIVISGITGLALGLYEASNPKNNRLIQDVISYALISFSAPALAALTANLMARSGAISRFLFSTLAGTLLIFASPVILLLVHCSSGDCL